jgi:hypothetical protein
LPENKALAMLLDEKIQKMKFHPAYSNAFRAFKALEEAVYEASGGPHSFIDESIDKLRRETELIRDEFKLEIDLKAEEIINELKEYEDFCNYMVEASSKILPKLDDFAIHIYGVIIDMEEWRKSLLSFEPNENEWNMIQEKSESYKNQLDRQLIGYRDILLLDEFYDYQQRVISFSKIQLHSTPK